MRARVRIIALLVATLAVGLVGQPALAGPPTYRFDLSENRSCPRGYGVPGETVTVTLRAKDGTRLARKTAPTDAGTGEFQVCLGAAATTGRTLIVKGGAGGHTLTIPRIDARVNRATNVLTGHAPAGATINGSIYQCIPGICAPELPTMVTVGPGGTFSKDLSPTDIDGSEFVLLAYTTAYGDLFRFGATAPFMEVRLPGSSQVRVWPDRSGTVTVTLRAPGGALRASATRTVTAGKAATFTLRRNGQAVAVRAGDVIDADFASDVGMTVPALGLTYDLGANTVSGHCFPNEWLKVLVIPDAGEADSASEQAGADGSFTASVGTLEAGWKVRVDCQDRRGDRFRLSGVAY